MRSRMVVTLAAAGLVAGGMLLSNPGNPADTDPVAVPADDPGTAGSELDVPMSALPGEDSDDAADGGDARAGEELVAGPAVDPEEHAAAEREMQRRDAELADELEAALTDASPSPPTDDRELDALIEAFEQDGEAAPAGLDSPDGTPLGDGEDLTELYSEAGVSIPEAGAGAGTDDATATDDERGDDDV